MRAMRCALESGPGMSNENAAVRERFMIRQMVIESPQARVPSDPRADSEIARAARELFLLRDLMEPAVGLPVMGAGTTTEKRP